MGTANSINLNSQGIAYYNGTGTFSGLDGSTSGKVLTSNGTGVAPSFQTPAVSGVVTINGDSGSVTGSTITFNAASQAGATVNFSGSSTTMSFNVTDGSNNTIIGKSSGNGSYSGNNNTFIGYRSGLALTSGATNVAVGGSAGSSITSGSSNTFFGLGAGQFISTGQTNVAIGGQSLGNNGATFNGSYNTALGNVSGFSYTGTESSNVIICNSGTVGDNNVIRIGTQGSGNQQQNTCYIAGIAGVSVSNQQLATINSSTGQMGSISQPAVSSTGIVTNTSQPTFTAFLSSPTSNSTGDGTAFTIIFDSTNFNVGTMYNTGTGVVTIPVAGKYLIMAQCLITGIGASHTGCVLDVISVSGTYGTSAIFHGTECNPATCRDLTINANDLMLTGQNIINFAASDSFKVRVTVSGSTKTIGVFGAASPNFYSSFSAVLLC